MPFSSVLGASSVIRPGVCTSTTRPSSPFDGQVIYETDTDRTLVWNNSAWVAVSYAVYTSSTRPSSPYEGQLIYETDTDRVASYDGSAWIGFDTQYASFTPTLTNLTLGNGTMSSAFAQVGKFVHYVGSIQLGSTSAMGVSPNINLPINCIMPFPINMGVGHLWDVTGNIFMAIYYSMSATQVQIAIQDSSSTFVAGTYIDFARPFTWAVSDVLTWNIFYRAA